MIDTTPVAVRDTTMPQQQLELSHSQIYDRLQTTPETLSQFCEKWQICELALFGSILREDFRAKGEDSSDIDAIVQFHREAHPTLFDLVRMEEELKILCQRDVDLVTRKGIETSRNYLRRKAILSSSRVIYGTRSSVSA